MLVNVQECGGGSIFRRADDVTRTMSKGGGACECLHPPPPLQEILYPRLGPMSLLPRGPPWLSTPLPEGCGSRLPWPMISSDIWQHVRSTSVDNAQHGVVQAADGKSAPLQPSIVKNKDKSCNIKTI